MKGTHYTFFIADSASGGMRRVRVPFYVLYALAMFALVGGITVAAATGSYTRMLWKVTNYNSLRAQQDSLTAQYHELQTQVKDTNQRLTSLQSLASEVAMAYGINRFHTTPFALTDVPQEASAQYELSVDEFSYLEKNATAVALIERWTAAAPLAADEHPRHRALDVARGRRDHRTLWRAA